LIVGHLISSAEASAGLRKYRGGGSFRTRDCLEIDIRSSPMIRVDKRRLQHPPTASRRSRLSRGCALLVVTGLAILAFMAHRPSSRVEARQLQTPDSTACEANIEGWKFPTEVPSYMQWEPEAPKRQIESAVMSPRAVGTGYVVKLMWSDNTP